MTEEKTISIHDIVRLSGGQELVVTRIHRNRPANPYNGVLVNGHGKEYKFGYKHRPIVIGHANENHPALVRANRSDFSADCRYMALRFPQWADKFNKLAELKAGAVIKVNGKFVSFLGVNRLSERYHLTVEGPQGGRYRVPIYGVEFV